MDADAVVHQVQAFALTENAIDLRQIGARVAAQSFSRIGGYMRQHCLILGGEHSDSIRQIQFAMLVVWFHLGQRRPKFLQSEAVDAGIDFVELALLVAKLRFLDDCLYIGFGFSQDASVSAGIADYRA